jgi:mono/diheme cytochrome c family protein
MLSDLISRAMLPAAALAATLCGAAVASSSSASAATHPSTRASVSALVIDSSGFYTEAQAERGLAVFKSVCAECHEMQDFTNTDFRTEWDGNSLYELFESIRTTMPDENPGTLAREQYVDVVTYLLKLNALPPGPAEFTADSASASAAILKLLPARD